MHWDMCKFNQYFSIEVCSDIINTTDMKNKVKVNGEILNKKKDWVYKLFIWLWLVIRNCFDIQEPIAATKFLDVASSKIVNSWIIECIRKVNKPIFKEW